MTIIIRGFHNCNDCRLFEARDDFLQARVLSILEFLSSRNVKINTFCIFSIGTDQLRKLIPSNASIDLTSKNTIFTVFVPDDDSFNYLTIDDIEYINKNLTYDERMEVTYCLFLLFSLFFF